MVKNDIEEFISKTIEKVKKGLPKDCELSGSFDFDISVTTKRHTGGKLDIHLAGIGHDSDKQQIHRVRFPIIDKKAREKNMEYVRKFLKDLASELPELEKK
jgi:hypothetical protein